MKFKFQWIDKIVEKLPEELKEKRKAEIGSCFTGTKKQLDEKVRKSLYEQVKIISVATVIFLIVLFLTIIFYFSQDRRILITRNETGGEVTEKQIRIKTKEDDDIYSLEIHPKGYTKAQITQAFDRGEAYLRKHLVAKNKSLNEVERNLEMPVKIPGENIAVQWQSDDPTVIDEEGNVFSKNVKKDYLMNLDARMECQGEVRILKIPVCVVPGNSGKKVSEKQKIIADHLSGVVNTLFANYKTSGALSLLAAVLCTIQLYMDFKGTIDIALGVGKIFGITIAENFRQPFFAKNAGDFWRRWHITLGAFLRDYVFYPVSLSKPIQKLTKWCKNHLGNMVARYVGPLIALFCVWICNGFWHGPYWTYVLYGMYYFILMVLELFLEKPFEKWCSDHHLDVNGWGIRTFRFIKLFIIVIIGVFNFPFSCSRA